MSDIHILYNPDGEPLDAHFSIEKVGNRLTLVFESSGEGKTKRNVDYDHALGLALQRLGRAQAILLRVEVDSQTTRDMSEEQRTINIKNYKTPIVLSGVPDYFDLRKKIGTGAAKTARSPTAKKSSSGNPRKRLRLYLAFTRAAAPSVSTLTELVLHGPRYDRVPRTPLTASAAEGPAGPSRKRGGAGRGQGYEQDTEVRQAVEEYAMSRAEKHYKARGWTATRRHTEKNGYDIMFSRGSKRIFVEVKGTRGPGKSVIVTRNEVDHARKHTKRTVLFVVTDIEVEKAADRVLCSGGQQTILENWDPHGIGQLREKDYWYDLPETP